MNRRSFLTMAVAAAGVIAVGASMTGEAMALPSVPDPVKAPPPAGPDGARVEEAHWRPYRHSHRRWRRPFWRRRRRWFRRRRYY